jgi:hypothetical protein
MPSYYWGPSTLIAGIPSAEKGAPNGVATLDGGGCVPAPQLCHAVLQAEKGVPLGVATLDGAGVLDIGQIPAPIPPTPYLGSGPAGPMSYLRGDSTWGNFASEVLISLGGFLDFVRSVEFVGGDYSVPTVEADVTDGAGFVELSVAIPSTEGYIVEVSGSVEQVQQNSGHSTFLNLSVDATPLALAQMVCSCGLSNNGESVGNGYMARFLLPLVAGARTIRLRARADIPTTGTSTLNKVATNPLLMTIRKALVG